MKLDNINDEKIDIVMIWVDGSDSKWQEEKIKYSDNPDAARNGINRYRDWGLLKYWFRGIEKFAPWVNNVYFITCGHYPEWLNLEHPKLKFLKHEDYIPKEYLPTFSSHPIELNLHRISELSDKFIYFNDDMFLINNISKKDFLKNGKPRFIAGCDIIYGEDYNDPFESILMNNSSIINRQFDKPKVIKKDFFKWFNFNYELRTVLKTFSLLPFKKFATFADPHIPVLISKDTMSELWEKEEYLLNRASKNKFRSAQDVNQYIFRWYEIARGNFEPASKKLGKYFDCKHDGFEKICSTIENQKYKMICFSDDLEIDFEIAKEQVNKAFEKILPEKSGFEK